MRARRLMLILIVILVLIAGYIYFAKPVLVLPTITMRNPETTMLGVYQSRLNINQLSFKARTNGTIQILGDGTELGYVSYNYVTLTNALELARKTLLTTPQQTALRVVQLLFPDLTFSALHAFTFAYFVLPIELTVQFVRG
jgi:hypothetical protein